MEVTTQHPHEAESPTPSAFSLFTQLLALTYKLLSLVYTISVHTLAVLLGCLS